MTLTTMVFDNFAQCIIKSKESVKMLNKSLNHLIPCQVEKYLTHNSFQNLSHQIVKSENNFGVEQIKFAYIFNDGVNEG